MAGAAISVAALVALAVGLARVRRLATILPFSFASHFVVMPVCIVASIAVNNRYPAAAACLFGFWVYYYDCVALKEKQVRYVPWAKGSAWRTARAAEQPELYWTCVALLMGLSAVILAGALVNAARGLS